MPVRRPLLYAFAIFLVAAMAQGGDPDLLARARALVARGDALQKADRVAEAVVVYTEAAKLAASLHDPALEARARSGAGYAHYNLGSMADALDNLQTAYRLFSELGDEDRKRDALSSIAGVYADTQVAQYDRAIEYYKQLLADYERTGKEGEAGDTLFNLGTTYDSKTDFKAAELNFARAVAVYQRLNRAADVAYTRRSIGLTLMKQNRLSEAETVLDDAIRFYQREHDEGNLVLALQYRGMVRRRMGRYADALRDLQIAHDYYQKGSNLRFLERNVEELALVFAGMGDWQRAYAAAQERTSLQQKLAESRRDDVSARLRVQFDFEKKDQENVALHRENSLREAALRESRRSQQLQIAIIALTGLLAVALALLFWRQVAHTRRMRTIALTDDLTRLPNRRNILTVAGVELDAARRGDREAALIMFDIDRFKNINDTYGHNVGDEVLKLIARGCRLAVRPGDQVGRIGGEEFLVVLHGATTRSQAAEVAERLRAAVEALDMSSVAEGLRATISLGVWSGQQYDLVAAMNAADAMLYRAKESGRNRVFCV